MNSKRKHHLVAWLLLVCSALSAPLWAATLPTIAAKATVAPLDIEEVAVKAVSVVLKQTYVPNSGKQLDALALRTWIRNNKVNLARLPTDLLAGIEKGTVDALLVSKVKGIAQPLAIGDVVVIRLNCNGSLGCSQRAMVLAPPGLLISGGSSADCDDCYQHCSGCEGLTGCGTYSICVCTMGKSPEIPCKTCPPPGPCSGAAWSGENGSTSACATPAFSRGFRL